MAHIEKFKAAALGGMCEHYARTPELERGYRRENIDPERTPLNYNLGPDWGCSQTEFIQKRIESLELPRAPRKDAVRMCDCVLTMPRSLDPDRSREFFERGYEFLCGRYGAENVVSAYVHMDEATPHMHFAWVPVTKDGRLSAKDVVNRLDLKGLHGDMQGYLEKAMGCPVEVILDPEKQGEKQLSRLNQSEYIAAKGEIARAEERLECLRQSIAEREMEPAEESIAESIRTLGAHRGDGSRERALAAEIEELRGREVELEREISGLRDGIVRLERRIESARESCKRLAGMVRGAFEGVGERIAEALRSIGVQAWAEKPKEIRREAVRLTVPTRKPVKRDLSADIEQAKRVARATSRSLDQKTHRRGGQAR